MKIAFPFLVFSTIAFSGCFNPPDFNSVPRIEYASIGKVTEIDPITSAKTDKVTITITFEDGDGDLGASAAELADEKFRNSYGGSGTYELVTVRKQADGSEKEYILSEDNGKWIPLLKIDNNKGPLKGKLDLNIPKRYANTMVPVEEKYKIRIRDRAMQYSNQVETDYITIPGYR
ncbi:hypothetical protein [Dyadobacter sp. CY323]|uniref:hypothetical protein n=1 Tax=Dyadobacter sp. CY323 TaxID=2907302 RepID=UPI001F316A40|nr:hypothetical protein [Dyadobacter sp. CY323]MCE6989417.1 hypothetical protein [Dyadobacter sp. CY323]